MITLRALEDDNSVLAEFEDHLTAGPAGRAGNLISSNHRNRTNGEPGGFRLSDGGKDSGAFSAVRQTIRGVLYIAAGKYFVLICQDSRPDSKVGVAGIRAPQSVPGGGEKFIPLGRRNWLGRHGTTLHEPLS